MGENKMTLENYQEAISFYTHLLSKTPKDSKKYLEYSLIIKYLLQGIDKLSKI